MVDNFLWFCLIRFARSKVVSVSSEIAAPTNPTSNHISMPDVPASEYLHSLLLAFQNADKTYSQYVSDVVKAEIRRDAARQEKDEAYARLEEAREKYSGSSLDQQAKDQPADTVEKRRLGNSNSFQKRRSPAKTNSFGNKGPQKAGNGNSSVASNGKAVNGTLQNGSMEKVTQRPTSHGSVDGGSKEDKKPPAVLQSPRAGSKKAPSIFRKASVRRAPQSGVQGKRPSNSPAVLEPLSSPSSVLELSKGRTREWLDSHMDCDGVGLVRKFYQASFGTKTSQETKKLIVCTIVLNDEWNVLVKTTAEVQEMYIGKGNSNGTNTGSNVGTQQPSLRDKAAEALAAHQKEPVALFFAPKKGTEPRDIFYGGHWRVIEGEMLNPPRIVNGQARQCLVKFEFVGLNNAIVRALNED